MFGIGMPELIVILVVALIIFGPKRLPEIGKSIGQAIKEFKKTSQELKEGIELDIEESPAIEKKTKTEEVHAG